MLKVQVIKMRTKLVLRNGNINFSLFGFLQNYRRSVASISSDSNGSKLCDFDYILVEDPREVGHFSE